MTRKSIIGGPGSSNLSVRERIEIWKQREGGGKSSGSKSASGSDSETKRTSIKITEEFSLANPDAVISLLNCTDGDETLPSTEVVEPITPTTPTSIPHKKFINEGLRLSDILRFIDSNGGSGAFEKLTFNDVGKTIIKPLTAETNESFTSYTNTGLAPATAFVICASNSNFLDVVNTLKKNFQDHREMVFWIDIFCVSLHDDLYSVVSKDYFSSQMKLAIAHASNAVLYVSPWNFPDVFTQLVSLFQLSCAGESKCKLDILMSESDENSLNNSLKNDPQTATDILDQINVEMSTCLNPIEKTLLHEIIVSSLGYGNMGIIIAEYLREWFIQRAKSVLSSPENNTDVQQLQLKSTMGNLLQEQGRLDEAEPLLVEVMQSAVAASGPDSTVALNAMDDLAGLYSMEGKFAEAEPILERSLRTRRQSLGDFNLETCLTYRNLALICESQGKYDEAETYYTKCYNGRLALKDTTDSEGELLEAIHELGRILFVQKKYNEAEIKLCEAYDGRLDLLGDLHPETCDSAYYLAMTYKALEKYCLAEAKLLACLKYHEAVSGPDHPKTFTTLVSLCELFETEGKYDETDLCSKQLLDNVSLLFTAGPIDPVAEQFFKTTYEGRLAKLGDQNPNTLSSLRDLAGYYYRIREYDSAEKHLTNCFENCKATLGGDHSLTLSATHDVGVLYRAKVKNAEAISVFSDCYEKRKTILGASHTDTITTCAQLAQLYSETGNYLRAEILANECLGLRRNSLGELHVDTLSSLFDLAQILKFLNKYDKAESYYLKCIEGRKAILGENHPDTLSVISRLGGLYTVQGRHNKAEPLYLQCVTITKLKYGTDHPESMAAMRALAGLYCSQGKFGKAEPLYAQCLASSRANLGESHPDTLHCINNLAGLYRSQGKYDKAEELYMGAWTQLKSSRGDDHPDTLAALNQIAGLYYRQGKYNFAEPMYKSCWESRKATLGVDHLDTLVSLSNLAFLYRVQSRYDEAEPLYEECLRLRKAKLGDKHPDTQSTLNNLVSLYRSQNKSDKAEELLLSS